MPSKIVRMKTVCRMWHIRYSIFLLGNVATYAKIGICIGQLMFEHCPAISTNLFGGTGKTTKAGDFEKKLTSKKNALNKN